MTDDPITRLVEAIAAEGPIGLTQAAKLFGTFREGKPAHPGTVGRYILTGVKLPDGSRVRLEGIRLGGRLVTSRQAVIRFLAAQNGQPPPPAPPRSPAERRRASEDAAGELGDAGI